MALRNTDKNTKIIAGLGGVLMKAKITFARSGMTGESTTCSLGTDRYRSEIKLPQGSIVDVLNADGAASNYFSQKLVHEGKYLEQARNGHPLASFLDWRKTNESVEVIAKKIE